MESREPHSYGRSGRTSALKSKLKYCLLFHCMLFFVMLAKLSPYLLVWSNLVTIDLEETQMPVSHLWEWMWIFSPFVSIFCLDAIEKNDRTSLHYYMYGTTILGIIPLLYGIWIWSSDVSIYLFSDDHFTRNEILYWKLYPYGVLIYAFVLLAALVHSFAMYFSFKLSAAWDMRRGQRDD